ncbi:MAG: type II toxin-antitoxin system RelE/ParE family toxin [Defluviitaleaceae bacterium]|nr:type II toxin-antitoxin system RelE/ParE family toxin [Defluviitaleaceae bacterium]
MKIYEIKFKKQALKFIKSRTAKEQMRLTNAIYKLPYAGDIVKMEGFSNRYRLRVGGVRIQYEKHDDVYIILVVRADNRGDAY